MAEWKIVRLGDIADVSWGDTSTTKAKYVREGFVAYSGSGPDGKLPYADYNKTAVVLCAIGANCGQTWLAKGKWSCIKSTMRFWSVDNASDTEFLYWATRGKELWPKRGSAQPFISQEDARNLIVSLPPLPTQRKIAAVLGAIDDKIETNRKICANLEAQAQALFKSWFVDFEPFGGKMPKGWKIRRFNEICSCKSEKKTPDELTMYAVTNNGIIPRERIFTKSLSLSNTLCKVIRYGDLVFGMSRAILNWGVFKNEIGGVSSAYHIYSVDRNIPSQYLESYISTHLAEFTQLIKPASREGQGFDADKFNDMTIYLPAKNDYAAFSNLENPIKLKYGVCLAESRALAAMRDALLPKLMSGEIDVSKVEVA